MNLSIIITTRDRKEKLISCLRSIEKSNLIGIGFEIVVIDDASTDGTEKLTPEDFSFSNLRIIHYSKNLMMAAARNVGARLARGGHVLFIDDDNVIDGDMIRRLIEFSSKNEKAGIIGPQMFRLDNRQKYFSCQKINFFTGKTNCYKCSDKDFFSSDGIPNVFMVKRVAFEKCGYFDDSLMQTFTEPDLYFRAKREEFECFTVEKAVTYHDIGLEKRFYPSELGGDFPVKAYCVIRNRSVMIGRYGKFYHKIIYGLLFSWVWPLFYSLAVLPHGRFDLTKLYWRGWWDGMVYLLSGKLIDL